MTSTIGIKLDEHTKDRLKHLGEARARSPHWLMRVAIQQYLEREERCEREKREDMERWEQYRLTGHAVPHDAVAGWLGNLTQGKSSPRPK